jgi:transposase-like protein
LQHDLKEMMAERGISIDHSTIHRWVPLFAIAAEALQSA